MRMPVLTHSKPVLAASSRVSQCTHITCRIKPFTLGRCDAGFDALISEETRREHSSAQDRRSYFPVLLHQSREFLEFLVIQVGDSPIGEVAGNSVWAGTSRQTVVLALLVAGAAFRGGLT